ncbi:MAG: hydrogenase maturation protease [Acidobacteria bacterium]|nr:hydrogenase maturation protease [Acidobacteriota bacterium]
MSREQETLLIVGIGNELLGDEGLGVHVARSLLAARDSLPARVEVLEAGTALLDFVAEMSRYSHVIIVDAVRAGQEAGTVYRVGSVAEFASQFEDNPPISLHEWNLIETLQVAEKLGLMPRQLTLIGAEPESLDPSTELSPKLAQAAEKIISILLAEESSIRADGEFLRKG